MKRENLKRAKEVSDYIDFRNSQIKSCEESDNVHVSVDDSGRGRNSVGDLLKSSLNIIRLMVIQELKQEVEKLEKEYAALDSDGIDDMGYLTTDKSEGGAN